MNTIFQSCAQVPIHYVQLAIPLLLPYQEVPEDDRNGDITHYTAEVRTRDQTRTFNQPNLPRTLKLASLPCKAGFSVNVYASTVAGRSPSTLLRVPGRDPGTLDAALSERSLLLQEAPDEADHPDGSLPIVQRHVLLLLTGI